jgi:hypothetical protein
MLNPTPTFTYSNNRRIDLTPGVFIPYHRSRRLPSTKNSYNRFSKPILKKVKSIQKNSKFARSDRQLIV